MRGARSGGRRSSTRVRCPRGWTTRCNTRRVPSTRICCSVARSSVWAARRALRPLRLLQMRLPRTVAAAQTPAPRLLQPILAPKPSTAPRATSSRPWPSRPAPRTSFSATPPCETLAHRGASRTTRRSKHDSGWRPLSLRRAIWAANCSRTHWRKAGKRSFQQHAHARNVTAHALFFLAAPRLMFSFAL